MAGAMARAASQSTIHPLDTLKVQMQIGNSGSGPTAGEESSAADKTLLGIARVNVNGSRCHAACPTVSKCDVGSGMQAGT